MRGGKGHAALPPSRTREKRSPLPDETGGEIDETAARRCSTCPADGAALEHGMLPYAPDVRGNSLGEREVRSAKESSKGNQPSWTATSDALEDGVSTSRKTAACVGDSVVE